MFFFLLLLFFQAEDGIRDLVRSRGLGDVYKRQPVADAAFSSLLTETCGLHRLTRAPRPALGVTAQNTPPPRCLFDADQRKRGVRSTGVRLGRPAGKGSGGPGWIRTSDQGIMSPLL